MDEQAGINFRSSLFDHNKEVQQQQLSVCRVFPGCCKERNVEKMMDFLRNFLVSVALKRGRWVLRCMPQCIPCGIISCRFPACRTPSGCHLQGEFQTGHLLITFFFFIKSFRIHGTR